MSVKASPLAQVCGTVMSCPAKTSVPGRHVALTLLTTTLPAVGAVQPVGTRTVVVDPAGNVWPAGEVNVST